LKSRDGRTKIYFARAHHLHYTIGEREQEILIQIRCFAKIIADLPTAPEPILISFLFMARAYAPVHTVLKSAQEKSDDVGAPENGEAWI
jgi:hypothetical protein